MTRRQLLSLLAITQIRAQQEGRAYQDCLAAYLKRIAQPLYEARKDWQAQIAFVNVVQQQQRFTRDNFWRIVGGRPETTPLQVKTTGSFERTGYRVEKLTYESQPGYLVTANLYIPRTGRPPYPGVLLQAGHGPEGKAYPTYQRCCQGLTQLGYVVLAFDPMGQGERLYYRELRLSPTDEHTYIGRQLLLAGDSCTRWQVWDSIRGMDVLASHPLVDPQRLASTGQSGGGTTTMLLAAVDDRLTTAVVSMGNTENYLTAGYEPPGSTDDAEQNLLPRGNIRLDRWDLLLPFAPRPLLVIVSSRDAGGTYSPAYLRNGREEFTELQRIYGLVGRTSDLAWAETPLPHGLGYHPRLLIYQWFQRFLKLDRTPVEAEPPTRPEPQEQLWAAGGDAVRAGSRRPHQIFQERAAKIGQEKTDLRAWLKCEEPPARPGVNSFATVPASFGSVAAFEVESVAPVWLPAFLFQPAQGTQARAWLVLDEHGRRGQAPETSMCSELAASGYLAYGADVRGVGESTPELPRGPAGYAQERSDEESWAWAGLLLERPLAGQRTTDILALVRAILARPEMAGKSLGIAANGRLTGPALWAANLEPRIAALALHGGLASFRQLAAAEEYRHPFSVFVPDALPHADFPALASRLGPRPVILARVLDGAGRPMGEAEVQRLYGSTGAAHVQVRQGAGWNAALVR